MQPKCANQWFWEGLRQVLLGVLPGPLSGGGARRQRKRSLVSRRKLLHDFRHGCRCRVHTLFGDPLVQIPYRNQTSNLVRHHSIRISPVHSTFLGDERCMGMPAF